MAGLRPVVAEAFGTFALVFAGTGAIIVNDVSGGVVTHVGIALTFGLVVLAMIAAVGDVSGAHLNPAVTLGLVVAQRFPARHVPGYLLAQFGGALVASLLWSMLVPEHSGLGRTAPAGSAMQSAVLEAVLTFLLMLVILYLARRGRTVIETAIAVGAVIGLEALFAGPISGASMNPARSLAPAAVSGEWNSLGIYFVGPLTGAVLAAALDCWLEQQTVGPAEAVGCKTDGPSV